MRIKGTTGDDSLYGTDGNDIIRGGRGADFIRGDGGHDILFAGRGKDTFVLAPDSFAVIVNFKPGQDRIFIDADLAAPGPGPVTEPGEVAYDGSVLYYDGQSIGAGSSLIVDDVL